MCYPELLSDSAEFAAKRQTGDSHGHKIQVYFITKSFWVQFLACISSILARVSWLYPVFQADSVTFVPNQVTTSCIRVLLSLLLTKFHSIFLVVFYVLFCIVLCIVCVWMCTELLPPGGYCLCVNVYWTTGTGGYTNAVNKYIISYQHFAQIQHESLATCWNKPPI
jgi:hypothetical protein